MSDLFGIWGGQPPGGWCNIWYPGCDQSKYSSTREEAERACKDFSKRNALDVRTKSFRSIRRASPHLRVLGRLSRR